MKRLLLIPLLLLLALPCQAQELNPAVLMSNPPQQLARMNPYILGAVAVASTTNYCNDASIAACYLMSGNGTDDETEPDISANGLDLTEGAADEIPLTTSVPSGYSGKARSWNAGNIYMGLAAASRGALNIYGANQDFSVCMWIWLGQEISSNLAGYASLYQWGFKTVWSDPNLTLSFTLSSNGTSWTGTLNDTTDLTIDTWYHVCAVYDDDNGSSENMQIWINGTKTSTASYTDGCVDDNSDFSIGTLTADTLDYRGYIDEVIIIKRALSSAEINDIKTNGIDGAKGANDN